MLLEVQRTNEAERELLPAEIALNQSSRILVAVEEHEEKGHHDHRRTEDGVSETDPVEEVAGDRHAARDAERLAHADEGRAEGAMLVVHAVSDQRRDRALHDVEQHLDEDRADADVGDGVGELHQDDDGATGQAAEDHPRGTAAELRLGAVGQRPHDRLDEHREHGRHAHDRGEVVLLVRVVDVGEHRRHEHGADRCITREDEEEAHHQRDEEFVSLTRAQLEWLHAFWSWRGRGRGGALRF